VRSSGTEPFRGGSARVSMTTIGEVAASSTSSACWDCRHAVARCFSARARSFAVASPESASLAFSRARFAFSTACSALLCWPAESTRPSVNARARSASAMEVFAVSRSAVTTSRDAFSTAPASASESCESCWSAHASSWNTDSFVTRTPSRYSDSVPFSRSSTRCWRFSAFFRSTAIDDTVVMAACFRSSAVAFESSAIAELPASEPTLCVASSPNPPPATAGAIVPVTTSTATAAARSFVTDEPILPGFTTGI